MQNDSKGISFTPIHQSGGSFTLSPEDAARVRAMAMENSAGGLTPEMEAAMNQAMGNDSQQDYDAMVTDDVHNSITHDIANKEIEAIEKEFVEREDCTAGKIPADMLESEVDQYKIPTQEDLEKQYMVIDQMPFLEVVAYKKKVDESILQWKSCKAAMKAARDYRLPDNVNRETVYNNSLSQYQLGHLKESEFDSEFEANMNVLDQLSGYLTKTIDEKKNMLDSTSKITGDMLSILEKNLQALTENKSNNIHLIQRLTRAYDAFSNRCKTDYIKYKLMNIIPSSKKILRKVLRDDLEFLESNRKTKIIKELETLFSKDIIEQYISTLRLLYNNDGKLIYAIIYFTHRIMISDKNSGNDNWVKVCVLNIADIMNNIYDLPEMSAVDYLNLVRTTMSIISKPVSEWCGDIRYPALEFDFK